MEKSGRFFAMEKSGDLKSRGAVFCQNCLSVDWPISYKVVILHRVPRALRSKINNRVPPPAEVERIQKGRSESRTKTESKPAETEKPKADESRRRNRRASEPRTKR